MTEDGITKVVQGDGWVRIELDDEFYIALNNDGMIIGRSNGTEQDDHAHVSALGADQIARTVMNWEFKR